MLLVGSSSVPTARASTARPRSVLSSRLVAVCEQSQLSLEITSTCGGAAVTSGICAEALVAARSSTSAPEARDFMSDRDRRPGFFPTLGPAGVRTGCDAGHERDENSTARGAPRCMKGQHWD